jgi:histidinol phosphatase-like PHP family hydrolase
VMTDHSPSSRIAGGLSPKDFYNQFKEIDRINNKIGRRFIKKGVEVDILPTDHLTLTIICLKHSNGLPHRCTADLQVTIPNDSSTPVIIH